MGVCPPPFAEMRRSLLKCVPSCRAGMRSWRGSSTPPSPCFFMSSCLQQRRGAFNKFEATSYVGSERNVSNAFNPLEMNLFDDPTGGLNAGSAEELSTAEIENQVRLNVSVYSRSLFYLLYTPFVDVISVALECGIVMGVARPGDVMCRWFTDGVATLQNPSIVEQGMGTAAWQKLCDGLDAFYEDVEPVMPVTAAVQKHGLPGEILVPFLRQLAMDLLVPSRKREVQEILPGLVLGMANGRAPASLGFPANSQRERAIVAADLFLGAGQETGNTDLAYLGIQLLRANDIPVPFPKQKQLTNVFSAATRIQTDWQMRVSGQLVEVLPKWMDYYKRVHHDNVQAMMKMRDNGMANAPAPGMNVAPGCPVPSNDLTSGDTNRNGCSGVGNGGDRNGDNSVHDYFTSHRAENLVRLSHLENRILQSVQKRDVAWQDDSNPLYSRFRRKKSPTVEELNEPTMKEEPVEDEMNEPRPKEKSTRKKATQQQKTRQHLHGQQQDEEFYTL